MNTATASGGRSNGGRHGHWWRRGGRPNAHAVGRRGGGERLRGDTVAGPRRRVRAGRVSHKFFIRFVL